MIFVAMFPPYSEIRIFFCTIKLWHIVLMVVALDIIMIPISNAGGNIAHLGGALFGYLYATLLRKGNDIGLWWDRSRDFIVGLFKSKRKTPFKKVYKNPKRRSKQSAD